MLFPTNLLASTEKEQTDRQTAVKTVLRATSGGGKFLTWSAGADGQANTGGAL